MGGEVRGAVDGVVVVGDAVVGVGFLRNIVVSYFVDLLRLLIQPRFPLLNQAVVTPGGGSRGRRGYTVRLDCRTLVTIGFVIMRGGRRALSVTVSEVGMETGKGQCGGRRGG